MSNIVYCAVNSDLISDAELNYISSFLPDDRLKKAEGYSKDIDRKNCIAAYFMLFYGLNKEYSMGWIPNISYNAYKKPFFVKEKHIKFNLSHCDNSVCCGFSDSKIGVDIQSKVHEVDSIVDLSMSPNEKDKIMGSEEPDLLFARYWSIKEAYMKCLGCGLNDKLSELDFSLFQNSHFIYDNLIFNTKYSRNVWITVCSAIDIRKIVIADIRDYIYSRDWTSLI